MCNLNFIRGLFINHNTNNVTPIHKQSTFIGEKTTYKSFRATALTDFQVGVTKNLFKILIDHCSYLLEFYLKSFEI